MTLADFTQRSLIVPRLNGREATDVLQELSVLLHRAGIVPDWLPVYNEALNRPFLLSTDPGSGLVFPYAHLPGVRQPSFAFGRSEHPIDWRPRRDWPAGMILLIAVPAMDSSAYFHLTTGLIQLAGDAVLLHQLRTAPDAGAIHATFARLDVLYRQTVMPSGWPEQ